MSWTIDSVVNLIAATAIFINRDSIVFHFYANTITSRIKLAFLVILLIPGASHPVLAVERNPDEGRAIQPSVGIRYDYDSNIYDSSMNEVGSGIGIITPAILFITPEQDYTLLYAGEYGRFFEDSTDNYADHLLSGAAQFHLGSRGEFDLIAAIKRGHWARGSEQTEGINPSSPFFPTKPDVYDRNNWGGTFRYGAEGNRGRLRFGFGGSKLDNTNNRERTKFYDYETLSGSAGLSLLFNQRTAVVLDAVFTDIRYGSTRSGEANLDSEDWRYLFGLTWEATAKSAGSIRFGIQQRRYDDSTLSETSNPTWEVDVRWSPREYSQFTFVSTRLTEETFSDGEAIDNTVYKVDWTHQWSQVYESIISWAKNDRDFIGSSRNQSLSEIYLGLRYAQGRHLTWEAGYTRRSRDSNISNLVFDADRFSIGVNIGI
jgi:hypothetical protein